MHSVVDWLSSNGRGNWARSKSGRLGRNSATAERGLFQLQSALVRGMPAIRHKVSVLFEFADDVGLAVLESRITITFSAGLIRAFT